MDSTLVTATHEIDLDLSLHSHEPSTPAEQHWSCHSKPCGVPGDEYVVWQHLAGVPVQRCCRATQEAGAPAVALSESCKILFEH